MHSLPTQSACCVKIWFDGPNDLRKRLDLATDASLCLVEPCKPMEDCDVAIGFGESFRADIIGGPVPAIGFQVRPDGLTLGPWTIPGTLGCAMCMEYRQTKNYLSGSDTTSFIPQPMIELLADELHRFRCGESLQLFRRAFSMSMPPNSSSSFHCFLPDSKCPLCNRLPVDSEDHGESIAESLSQASDVYRIPAEDLITERVQKRLVDRKFGFIRNLAFSMATPFPSVAAEFQLDSGEMEVGVGRGFTTSGLREKSVLEALERYASQSPRARRTNMRCCYEDIMSDAIDPRELGMHLPDVYHDAAIDLRPFDPCQDYNWVWGHSLRRRTAILVPEQCVYFYRNPMDERFLFEISNGCAIGSNLAEAAFYGLLEVVERDAFLMWWYHRRALRSLPSDLFGVKLNRAVRKLERDFTGKIRIFDLESDVGVPSVLVVLDSESTEQQFSFACAAAAHVSLEKALFQAVQELSASAAHLQSRLEVEADYAKSLLDDPDQVLAMSDHSLCYALPEARSKLDFLLNARSHSHDTDTADSRFRSTETLAGDLQQMIGRILDQGLDVVIVDHTPSELAELGLASAKVIVPGMVPMTFGHRLRRTIGLRRLDNCCAGADALPHPFP